MRGFGERLKAARKVRGLSQRKLANMIDNKVCSQTISKYEANKITPSVTILCALAQAMEIEIDLLVPMPPL